MNRPVAGRLYSVADAVILLDNTVSFLNNKLEMRFVRSELSVRLMPNDGGDYGSCETFRQTSSQGVVTNKCTISLRTGLSQDFAVVVMTHELTHYWMNTKWIAPNMHSQRKDGDLLDEVICELMGALAAQAMRWDAMKDSQVRAARSFATRFGAREARDMLTMHIERVISRHSGIVSALLPVYLSAMKL